MFRKKPKAKLVTIVAVLTLLIVALAPSVYAAQLPPTLLDPTTIPKYVNQLTGPPPVYVPTIVTDNVGNVIRHDYTVTMTSFMQQILPSPLPATPVWGYGGDAKDAVSGALLGFVRNSPGSSFEAVRGVPIQVTWQNGIITSHMFPVDPTLHWANPENMEMPMAPFTAFPPGYENAQYPVPLVPHLHGAEVQSYSDGVPEQWWTWDGKRGIDYSSVIPTTDNAAVYYYPNEQQPTTLWYHDHALGITRINVMSGLAGFYLLRDNTDTIAPLLPTGKYEVPLVIQDRTFNIDGTMFFPNVGINPDVHPYWMPEFFGNTIMVNGLVWPNMDVDAGQYRFRLLNGSNARFYTLTLLDPLGNFVPFTQIGSDGGYLKAPVVLTKLTIAPGERADILVDFSAYAPGTKIFVKNSAKAPFPKGTPPDPKTVGQIMQFTLRANTGFTPSTLPIALNNTLTGTFPNLPAPTKTRILTLVEIMGALGPLEVLLNGQKWHGIISELPSVGSTEEWVIVNTTADAHPIHLHLTQFQLVSRQKIQASKYLADWMVINGMPPFPIEYIPTELPTTKYLVGKPTLPLSNEQCWKDTIQMYPGEVTVIRVRFAKQDGTPFTFDATQGPGYVWHCHILDHEDDEMMRRYKVVP